MEGTLIAKITRLTWLTHPLTIIIGATLGVVIGLCYPATAGALKPYGDIYLSLIKMTIYPILVTAVAYSFASILRSAEMRKIFKKLGLAFFIGMIVSSVLGVVLGVLSGVGSELDSNDQNIIGQYISQHEDMALANIKPINNAVDFFHSMVPDNIFNAFSESNTLGILLFSILLGVSLGMVKSEACDATLRMFEGLYETFLKLLNGILHGLPFALVALFANLSVILNDTMLVALSQLIFWVYLGGFILIISYTIIMSRQLKVSFFKVLIGLRRTLMIAFTTSTSYAAIPHTIRALTERFHLDETSVKLGVPVGTSIGQQCSAFTFSLLTIFIAQLYNVPLDFNTLLIVAFASILAGIAAGGSPPIVALVLFSIPLNLIGLPVEAAIAIFIIVINIMDPIITVANVNANCTAISLVAKRNPRDSLKFPI